MHEACFRVSLKHASLWAEIFKKIEVEGVADGDDPRGKGGICGRTQAVYEACFRVSLKHASLWAETFKKLRLKGLQMEMILGEREVVVGGQRSCTAETFKKLRLKGLRVEMIVGKGGYSCGRTQVVHEACFRASPKHAASLWAETFKKLRLKGLQMEMILGEREVVVWVDRGRVRSMFEGVYLSGGRCLSCIPSGGFYSRMVTPRRL